MNKALIIAFKEWRSFAASPVAYVMGFISVAVFNVFFYLLVDQNQEASLRDIFAVMEFMNLFFVPMLTMRLLAEEKSQGTMEFLLTTPTRVREIVIGKFLSAWGCVALLSAVVLVYGAVLVAFSKPDIGEMICGWIGFLLESAFLVAIGVLVSSLTRYQFIAAIVTMFVLFALFLIPVLEPYASGGLMFILKGLGTTYHLENFTSGFIGAADIVYYGMGIAFSLIAARYAAEYRLWH